MSLWVWVGRGGKREWACRVFVNVLVGSLVFLLCTKSIAITKKIKKKERKKTQFEKNCDKLVRHLFARTKTDTRMASVAEFPTKKNGTKLFQEWNVLKINKNCKNNIVKLE